MRNYVIVTEYDGTGYRGWQVQNNGGAKTVAGERTVQGVIESALFRLFGKKTKVISSSRTDAGVHARAHVSNFRVSSRLDGPSVKRALNGMLPDDVLVKSVREADEDFHSQFTAKSKLYRYIVYNGKDLNVFDRNRVYHFKQPLNEKLMASEASCLIGRHDFTSFRSSHGRTGRPRNPVRTIKVLRVKRRGARVIIDIEADGFLYCMARNIVGTLIEAGRGRLAAGEVKRILRSRDRRKAGPAVPGKGLCLIRVKYD